MRKKLLLADDSITIQKVVELTFPSDEFEVVTAGNGRVAVDKAMTFLPDMVLCDVIMPQLDGYQVCEALRASPQLKDVPILLLNGAFEPYDADRASAVGAMGNVSKPFDPPALVARVKAILSERASAAVESLAPPASLQAGSEQEITDHEIVEPGTPLGDIADDEIAAHEVTEMEGAEAEHAPYPAAPEAAYEEPGYEEPAYDEAKTMDIALPEAHPAYDDSETHPVSTVEVPIGIRELAARSLVLDAPVFGQAEADEIASPDGQAAADVLTADEPSDFSETLHGPLDLEAPATEAEQTGEFDTAALGHAEVLETMAEAEGAASAELTASDVGEIEAPQGHPGVAEFEFDADSATTEAHAPDTLPAGVPAPGE